MGVALRAASASSLVSQRSRAAEPLSSPYCPGQGTDCRMSMEQLNGGMVQLGLVALVFGGLQIWWIGSTLRGRRLARPMTEQEFRRSLERIWSARQPGR